MRGSLSCLLRPLFREVGVQSAVDRPRCRHRSMCLGTTAPGLEPRSRGRRAGSSCRGGCSAFCAFAAAGFLTHRVLPNWRTITSSSAAPARACPELEADEPDRCAGQPDPRGRGREGGAALGPAVRARGGRRRRGRLARRGGGVGGNDDVGSGNPCACPAADMLEASAARGRLVPRSRDASRRTIAICRTAEYAASGDRGWGTAINERGENHEPGRGRDNQRRGHPQPRNQRCCPFPCRARGAAGRAFLGVVEARRRF